MALIALRTLIVSYPNSTKSTQLSQEGYVLEIKKVCFLENETFYLVGNLQGTVMHRGLRHREGLSQASGDDVRCLIWVKHHEG